MSADSVFGAALDKFLADRSYVEEFSPTSADADVLTKLASLSLEDDALPHVKRWRNHVVSFTEEERKNFPRSKTSSEEYLKLIGGGAGEKSSGKTAATPSASQVSLSVL